MSAAEACVNAGGTPAATVGRFGAPGRPDIAARCPYPREGGACARRLCCRINSANENACNGGPVSSNSGEIVGSEQERNAPLSAEKFVSLNFASSRVQAFDCAKTTARSTLQHWTWEDCSFCFAGLEWNGHSVWFVSMCGAIAANAQWFEIVIHEQITTKTTAHRMLVFISPLLKALTPDSFREQNTQTFSCESTIGAIAAEGMLSGGTTSGTGPVVTGRISGCSTRVAMSIAVKSSAPARR